MSDGHDHLPVEHELPHDVTIHTGEVIPIYGHHHTNCALASGAWSDPNIWELGTVPSPVDKVCVPVGLSVVITEQAICMDLVITGRVTIAGGKLSVRTVTVLPTGYFGGTDAAKVVFRDFPIDTTKDPSQFGNGLIVIDGEVDFVGKPKKTWATPTNYCFLGQLAIEFKTSIDGWKAGDRIVLPHTLQDDSQKTAEVCIIRMVEGNKVYLLDPVLNTHPFWRAPNGDVESFDIGNLDQSIEFSSENPSGTRGHCMFTHHADVTLRNVVLRHLGRTTTAPLSSHTKNPDGTWTGIPGTNQIGRYSCHFHHCVGRENNGKPYQALVDSCVVESSPKWGIALHTSHFGAVTNNFLYDCAGAHIVTEDPLPYGFVIDSNVIAGNTRGSGQRITERAHRNLAGGDHWHDRVGLGLESMMGQITNNRIYGCKEGIGMAGFETSTLYYPKKRGIMLTGKSDPNAVTLAEYLGYRPPLPRRYPFLFDTSGNKVMGGRRGFETWTVNAYQDYPEKMFPGLKIVHCEIPTDFEDQRETTCYDWQILGDFSKIVAVTGNGVDIGNAVAFKGNYEFGASFIRCKFRGYSVAYRSHFPSDYTNFIDCEFECPMIVYQGQGSISGVEGGWQGRFKNCKFNKVSGKLMFIAGNYPKYHTLWFRQPAVPPAIPAKAYAVPVSVEITPWIDGRNIKVYHSIQHKDFALPAITDPTKAYADLPVGCWTQKQFAEKGKPIFGEVTPDWCEVDPAFQPGYFHIATITKPLTLEERVAELERWRRAIEGK